MGGHTLRKLLIGEIIGSCRYSVQALLQAWQGLDIIDRAGFHKHNAHSGYLVPGFGHCFACIKWPAYSSVLAHFLTHFTCTSFCYSFVPCQQMFYCTVFIGVALLGMCCGCSPRVPLQFSALGPISATAAFTLAFLPRLWLSCFGQLYWAFRFLCVLGSIVIQSEGWCNKSYSLMLHYCCIIQFFVRFPCCNMFEQDLQFVHLWQEKKKFMHVI